MRLLRNLKDTDLTKQRKSVSVFSEKTSEPVHAFKARVLGAIGENDVLINGKTVAEIQQEANAA